MYKLIRVYAIKYFIPIKYLSRKPWLQVLVMLDRCVLIFFWGGWGGICNIYEKKDPEYVSALWQTRSVSSDKSVFLMSQIWAKYLLVIS